MVGHRQYLGADPQRGGDRGLGLGQPIAGGQPPSPLQAVGEVAVPEVEPDVDAQFAQAVHDGEGVAVQPPPAAVDPVSEPEGDEIGIGRDVGAVDLDVVAGVGDHHELSGTRDIEHAAGQLGASGPTGEHDHRARGR